MADSNDFQRMRDAAKYYAHVLGWFVIPVWPPKFDGSESDGKIPGRKEWEKKASRSPSQVGGLWAWWLKTHGEIPNIGIATGPSGLTVVDSDPRTGGDILGLPLTFEERCTATVTTGSGGTHLYYKTPADKRFTNTAGILAPGIDTRASGGYVVAPPSLHKSEERYLWIPDASPKHGILELPDCLVELLEAPVVEQSGDAPRQIPKTIPRGTRQNTLFSAAGMMRWKGFTEEAIYAALVVENELRCDPPLPETEIKSISKSAGRYGAGDGGESDKHEHAIATITKAAIQRSSKEKPDDR